MPDITIQGSFDAPRAYGVEHDESKLYRIACAQVSPSDNGVHGEGGLAKLQRYTKEAASRGADVIMFPEYFLTGATHDIWRQVRHTQRKRKSTDPESDTDHFLAIIAETARTNDIDIVAGTVVELGSHHIPHRQDQQVGSATDDEHDDKLFNTVYYIDRTGKIAGRYTKRNLWHPEKETLSPGHELRHESPQTFTITTRSGQELRAGLRICWDLAFPESFREMFDVSADCETLTGPDIVFAPICWYATDAGQKGVRWNRHSEAAVLDSFCMSRALENECILAMTNVAGSTRSSKPPEQWTEDDAIAVGRTCVCSPFLGCAARIDGGDEGLLLSCIDLRILDDARSVYKCRQDIKEVLCSESKMAKGK